MRATRTTSTATDGDAEAVNAPRVARAVASWITLAIVLGLLVRVARLGESLWYDEIAALLDYAVRGPRFIVSTWYDPANHVLQSLLSWLSLALLPQLDVALAIRLPSLLLSLATIPIIAALLRETRSARMVILAALLTAVMPVVVLSGIEARGYAGMIASSAGALWLMRRIEREGRGRDVALYAVVMALGVWFHLTTMFVAVGHALVVAWPWSRGAYRWRALGAIGGAAVLTLVCYAPMLGQIVERRATFSSADGNEPSLFGPEMLHALFQLGGAWALAATVPGLIVVALGVGAAWREPALRRIIGLGLAGGIALVIVAAIIDSWLYARFLLFMAPGAIVALTIGIESCFRRHAALGVLACAFVVAPWSIDLAARPPKQPLREAVAWVDAQRAGDDGVLVIGIRGRVTGYYTLNLAWHEPAYSLRLGADLERELAAARPTWVIMLYPSVVAPSRHEMLRDAGFREVQRFDGWVDWGRGDVVILHRATESARTE